MATSTELTGALARAHAQVRAIDWSTWQVPPGDARLAEYLFAHEPPLTNGLVGTYLSTCSWIWARPITQDETQRVSPLWWSCGPDTARPSSSSRSSTS